MQEAVAGLPPGDAAKSDVQGGGQELAADPPLSSPCSATAHTPAPRPGLPRRGLLCRASSQSEFPCPQPCAGALEPPRTRGGRRSPSKGPRRREAQRVGKRYSKGQATASLLASIPAALCKTCRPPRTRTQPA